jgi:hypothetical protein
MPRRYQTSISMRAAEKIVSGEAGKDIGTDARTLLALMLDKVKQSSDGTRADMKKKWETMVVS